MMIQNSHLVVLWLLMLTSILLSFSPPLISQFFSANKRLVYEEMKKAVEKDRSTVGVSELSKLGLMEITRKRVRESVVNGFSFVAYALCIFSPVKIAAST